MEEKANECNNVNVLTYGERKNVYFEKMNLYFYKF